MKPFPNRVRRRLPYGVHWKGRKWDHAHTPWPASDDEEDVCRARIDWARENFNSAKGQKNQEFYAEQLQEARAALVTAILVEP